MITPLFYAADKGDLELITSAVTLLEVLVVPLRAKRDEFAARYETLLTNSRGIRLIDMTRAELRRAARVRASTGMRTPDALQLAAALGAGCSVFLTNDRRAPSLPGLRVLQLSSYAGA